jgi:hypothetical protein
VAAELKEGARVRSNSSEGLVSPGGEGGDDEGVEMHEVSLHGNSV